ncbi:hypothetical protein [Actinomycetospora straminea]|nr:hypothetical protein [Actinomycetospora straminea]MDD7934017.1 hypothetical protein [Actinomycetospora straminea]
MLTASPDGLSDAALARELGDGVRTQTVNQLCRRLAAEGALERVGTRPILNRLPAPPRRKRRAAGGQGRGTTASRAVAAVAPPSSDAAQAGAPAAGEPAAAADSLAAPVAPGSKASPATEPAAEDGAVDAASDASGPEAPAAAGPAASVDPVPPPSDAPGTDATPATDPVPPAARTTRRSRAKADTVEETAPARASSASSTVEEAPAPQARTRRRAPGKDAAAATASSNGAAPAEDHVDAVVAPPIEEAVEEPSGAAEHEVHPPPASSPTYDPPPYDALQAWSRVVNVQALVAGWLVRRGATLRWATVDGTGPARDLVASLDGDDVHVEVTGWPADGARTHPTTIAGDWFSAAEHAAAERRRAHPRARIVIALPDTRRYRSLAEQRAASLAGARAEVWFVDAAGSVHAR